MGEYIKQNFEPGQILTAEQLNYIESYMTKIDPFFETIEEFSIAPSSRINIHKNVDPNGQNYKFQAFTVTLTMDVQDTYPSVIGLSFITENMPNTVTFALMGANKIVNEQIRCTLYGYNVNGKWFIKGMSAAQNSDGATSSEVQWARNGSASIQDYGYISGLGIAIMGGTVSNINAKIEGVRA